MIINENLIKSVIHLIRAYKEDSGLIYPKYTLNAVLRQMPLPDSNYFVSEGADKLWNDICESSIWDYRFSERFHVNKDVDLPQYVGSGKIPAEIKSFKKGDKVKYNSVFHDEHIVRVDDIVNELYDLPEEKLNVEEVEKIILKLYVCKILKEEDRRLPHKRPSANLTEVYEQVYIPNNVFLMRR